MDATELLVRGVVVGLFQENCYIIGSRQTGEAICVDPGDEVDEIRALAREMRVTITKIACSHAHLDHIMAVRALKEETGAPYLLHQYDLELSRQMPEAALRMLGRVERPLRPPRRPWEVAQVAFEVARRHRFARELSEAPPEVAVHVLPTGGGSARDDSPLSYRNVALARARIERAYRASCDYLEALA